MPIVVRCPSCKTRLKMADERAGETVECPKCTETMQLPEAHEPDPPSPPPPSFWNDEPDPDDENEDKDEDAPRGRTKYCHECGKKIRSRAEICPKCGVRQSDGSDDRPAGGGPSRDGIKIPLLISGIANIVVGIIWAATCFGVFFTIPMIVLSVLEFILWSQADRIPKRRLANRAFNMAIFEIVLGIANTPTLICGIILMVNSSKMKK